MHLARILAGAVGSALLQPVVAAPAAHSEQPSSLTRRHLQGHGGHGGHGGHKGCPPLNRGSYNIQQYQLYPENADWDEDSCLVYFGALWTATVAIYDPYKDAFVRILTFPHISNTGTAHIGGVAWDRFTGLITILVDSAAPWATNGADVSGTNLVIKWDPATAKALWTANLTATTQGRYGAFQDIETDARGYTYVVGTFPGSILRVSPRGDEVVPWYGPVQTADTTVPGLGGLVALGDAGTLLLANDAGNGSIYRMDTRAARVPTHAPLAQVPIHPDVRYSDTDAIYAPPRYGGTVLLVASHAAGTQVLFSHDARWTRAQHLGTIPNPPRRGTAPPGVIAATQGSMPTAAVQMGSNAVYLVDEFFADPWVAGEVAGNRTVFPMVDLTAQIDALLAEA